MLRKHVRVKHAKRRTTRRCERTLRHETHGEGKHGEVTHKFVLKYNAIGFFISGAIIL